MVGEGEPQNSKPQFPKKDRGVLETKKKKEGDNGSEEKGHIN